MKYDALEWHADFSAAVALVPPGADISDRSKAQGVVEDGVSNFLRSHYGEGMGTQYRFERLSLAILYFHAHIQSFTVGGLVLIGGGTAEIHPDLVLSLWHFFGDCDDADFNPSPDPQAVVELAEYVKDGE